MAACAPLLFLLVFGMLEAGRAIMVQHLLTNAARDGARSAILEGTTAEEIESDLVDFLAQSSVPGATVTVSPDPLSTADIGDPVSVTCHVGYDSVSWLPSSMYFGGVTLQATITMRRETTADTTGEEEN
jgi:Flp pilus assembly protein TadG